MKRLGTAKILTVILASSVLVGCMGAAPAPPPQSPGLYGGVYYYTRSGNLTANVGLPVNWMPLARCVGGKWSRRGVTIVSGELPPGLRIDPAQNSHIVGVPKRAGTWHLRVSFNDVRCAGKDYGDKTQDLHITTRGSSAPRRIP